MKFITRFALLIALLCMALPIFAQDDTTSTEPTPEITPEATFEVSDIIERDLPTKNPDVLMNQDIVLFDGTLAMTIPSNWVFEEDIFNASIATSEEAFDLMDDAIEGLDESEMVIQFVPPATTRELPIENISPLGVVEYVAIGAIFEDLVVYTYPDFANELYYLTFTGEDIPEGAFFMMMQLGDTRELLLFAGVVKDFDAQEALIFKIIETIVYTPPTEEE